MNPTNTRDVRPFGLITRLLQVFPNLPGALLVLVFATAEALLLRANADHSYRSDPWMVVLVPVALFWVWFSAVWTLWFVARPVSDRMRSWPRVRWVVGVGVVGLGGLGLVAGYLASWMLYIQSGRFLEIHGVRFIANNPRMLGSYMLDAQPSDLVIWVFAFACGAIVAIVMSRWFLRSRWPAEGTADMSSRRRLTWYIPAIVLGLGLILFPGSLSEMRTRQRLDGLTHRLNPIVALGASILNVAFEEHIDADLDLEGLHRIGPIDWKPPELTNPPSIVFIAVESMRPEVIHLRHQDRLVMPTLSALAKDSHHFTRVYSQCTHTDYSDPCIWSSLYPLRSRRHHYYRRSDPWPKVRIFDLLHAAGYATAYVSSQNECWGNMDQFMASPNLDLFFHSPDARERSTLSGLDVGAAAELAAGVLRAGKLEDRYTTDVALGWLKEYAGRGKPVFLGLSYQSSHFPYLLPGDVERPFQPCEPSGPISFVRYPPEQAPVLRNAYYNALRESDRNIGRVVKALQDLGRLDNAILVIFGDHGECFHEHGVVTHAGKPIEPALRVGCVIHAPNRLKPGIDDYPTELIDLIPTVFGLMGWPRHPNFQGIDVRSPGRPPLGQRLLFTHLEIPGYRWDGVQHAGRWKFLHDRGTGQESLFDLATDPDENVNLLTAEPERSHRLREVLRNWRRRQLAYYHYPAYYRDYYPPDQPRLAGQIR